MLNAKKNLFDNRKLVAALVITIFVVGIVATTAIMHQQYAMSVRETFAYKNPVTVDLWKRNPDNSLVPNGWVYLGLEVKGYHYRFMTHNKIMNTGQAWMTSLIDGQGATGKLAYIALGTNAVSPSATDVSLIGGESGSAGLTRAQAASTAQGAAAGGTITWTLVNTFTALTAVNSIQIAGLFTTTGANSATMFAETTFAAVNLASGDTLTITWSITSGGN